MKTYDDYFTRNVYFSKEAVKNLKAISEMIGDSKLSHMVAKALKHYANSLKDTKSV